MAEQEKQVPITVELQSDRMLEQFARALPSVCTPERFVRFALTAVNSNPKLKQCTRESVFSCMMTCAEIGIEPDGRRAHLIPYKDKCTLIIDYKGIIELVSRGGNVVKIHCDKVCDSDEFIFDCGEIVSHRIDFKARRGSPYCYYCVITMKDGSKKTEVMTIEEVNSIRGRSKAADDGPWVTDYDEMAKKTVFRRCAKWIPWSTDVKDALQKIDEHEFSNLDPAKKICTKPQVVDTVPLSEPAPAPAPDATGNPY